MRAGPAAWRAVTFRSPQAAGRPRPAARSGGHRRQAPRSRALAFVAFPPSPPARFAAGGAQKSRRDGSAAFSEGPRLRPRTLSAAAPGPHGPLQHVLRVRPPRGAVGRRGWGGVACRAAPRGSARSRRSCSPR